MSLRHIPTLIVGIALLGAEDFDSHEFVTGVAS